MITYEIFRLTPTSIWRHHVERLSSNPENGTSGSSASDLSHLGRVVNATLKIDLSAMFGKANYLPFLLQGHAENIDGWTGVETTFLEPFEGEFAASVECDGKETATNLSFAGMFKDTFGKPNLLLVVSNGEDEEQICPDIHGDDKLFFLICNVDPREIAKKDKDKDDNKNAILQCMAIVDENNWSGTHVRTGDVAYTMLHAAYLSALR